MKNLLSDFLEKAQYIIKDKEKLSELENITADLLTKCTKIYEIREGVILIDKDKKIIEANEILKNSFNIDPEKIRGKNFYELFENEFRDVIDKFLEKADKKGYSIKNKIYLNFKNNSFLVDIKAEKIYINNKFYYLITIRQKEINSVTYKLSVIEEEVSNLIVRIKDFESLMKEVLKVFVHSGLFEYGWIAKIDLDLKEIIPVVTLEEENIDLEFKKRSFDFGYFKGVLDMLLKDEEVIIKDVKFRNKEYKKSLIFPIYKKWEYKNENEIAYAALFYSDNNLELSSEDFLFLKEIIYKINIAITDIFIKEKANLIVSTDTLTLLPKREIFVGEIKKLIKEKIPFALAVIDIDKLKKVNEVLGFWAGDKAIKKLTDFLKNNLKHSFMARIGSDEFGVILKGDKKSIFKNLEKILNFNDDIVQINGSGVYLPVSVGVAFYPDDGIKEEDLIILAEEALKSVKKRGGKGIGYANKSLTLLPKDYLEIEKELKEAIQKDEFVMYYQPIIDVHNNKLWGVEALLRWNSEKRGLVPPNKFIPILEESGLIREVGDVIIEKVLRDAKEFEDKNLIFTFSMNVSVIQLLSENLAYKLIKKIEELNVKKEQIVVEITESVLMENVDIIMPQIELLQKEGISIEIDDFGTGYSSLSYLRRLPVSALKIDRSFVLDVLKDEGDRYIVDAIISMAKALHKKTIAEGVETKEIADYLKKAGVDYIQGYYFAKPMPKEALKGFIENFN